MSILDAPQLSPSIFSHISQLSRKHKAINLGQGFPDFAPDDALTKRLAYHTQHSSNQYAPMTGLPRLLQRISEKVKHCHDVDVDVKSEITISSGATQAIWTAIQSTVKAGDEVIVFEPAYDSYAPAVRSVGGTVIPFVLEAPNFQPDWDHFAALVSDKTKMVIINNPHNPIGKCWRHEDLLALEQVLTATDIVLLSDEVYEHLVYDGNEHLSALRYPGLRKRAFVTASFGKTFHVTGWKVGYVIAPEALSIRFRNVHQFTVFTVNTPAQHAIADHLEDKATYEDLPVFFQQKRDSLYRKLEKSNFKLMTSEGSYFGLIDYSSISDEVDSKFAEKLIIEYSIATIPISPFYSKPPAGQQLLRVCFAKKETTLQLGASKLCQV